MKGKKSDETEPFEMALHTVPLHSAACKRYMNACGHKWRASHGEGTNRITPAR